MPFVSVLAPTAWQTGVGLFTSAWLNVLVHHKKPIQQAPHKKFQAGVNLLKKKENLIQSPSMATVQWLETVQAAKNL